MDEMYNIADKLIAEFKRIEHSGTVKSSCMAYKIRIIDYLEDKMRVK
jgi:hypothetical protein